MSLISREIHAKYSERVGAEQIANLFALEQLDNLISGRNFKLILELGAGIGTITELLLRSTESELICIESNAWCSQKLLENTAKLRGFTVLSSYKEAISLEPELLIVDVNNGIFQILPILVRNRKLKTIFIEGHHLAHRVVIARWLLQTGKSAHYLDLRPAKGEKGCAIFELYQSPNFGRHYLPGIVRVVIPIFSQQILVKIRSHIRQIFELIDPLFPIKTLRKLWLNKIKWKF